MPGVGNKGKYILFSLTCVMDFLWQKSNGSQLMVDSLDDVDISAITIFSKLSDSSVDRFDGRDSKSSQK